MSRSRMFGDDAPGDADNASPRRTIVGSRPPEPRGALPPVPTGIQRLLRMAALDASFMARLLELRGDIAAAADVELSATEKAILRAIPSDQIVAMVENLPPPAAPRREFLRQSAASAVVLLGGAALAACEACSSPPGPVIVRGAQSDMPPEAPPPEPPPPRPEVNEMQTEGGAAPHEPPPPRPEEMPRPAGIMPDLPPEPEPPRPDSAQPTRGIRPDRVPEK